MQRLQSTAIQTRTRFQLSHLLAHKIAHNVSRCVCTEYHTQITHTIRSCTTVCVHAERKHATLQTHSNVGIIFWAGAHLGGAHVLCRCGVVGALTLSVSKHYAISRSQTCTCTRILAKHAHTKRAQATHIFRAHCTLCINNPL